MIKVYQHMLSCKRCVLHKSRNKVVVGRGNKHARYMLVGEAPGREEDEKGEPFVGKSGRKLEELLVEAGFNVNDDFYITNVVKCRPPDNRRPSSNETLTCSQHLLFQIETIRPQIIVTAGNTPLQYFCPDNKIMSSHGIMQTSKKVKVPIYPIIHPAAGLRSPELFSLIIADLKTLRQKADELIVMKKTVAVLGSRRIK